jgi:hypothetical protein
MHISKDVPASLLSLAIQDNSPFFWFGTISPGKFGMSRFFSFFAICFYFLQDSFQGASV